jgi:hypothetical protein
LAATWLLLYGLNAYWLTAVHKPRRSLLKRLVFTQPKPVREYQTAQAVISPSLNAGAIAANGFDTSFDSNFDNFEQFRLDKFSYVLAAEPTEHYAIAIEDLPVVTIQLPIFNER